MITRLKVNGFKNLVDVDIRFGTFTCIAGTNAVGKSNLFDAMHFLSDLTHKSLIDAAKSVRSEGQKNSDIRELFHRVGDSYDQKMTFEVEMIIPKTGIDDLGQTANASITSVRYKLVLALKETDTLLEIIEEVLMPITQEEAKRNIEFEASTEWKSSIIKGRRPTSSPFISTLDKGNGNVIIRLHQDGLKGKPLDRKATQLPKTVLSSADATQNPTALLVKNEMQSWQMLQLEPGALRKSDELHLVRNAKLGVDGSCLPATLYRLQKEAEQSEEQPDVYQQLANRLAELIADVGEIGIDKDEKRELLTLKLRSKDGTWHPARALSDGTLRFLGLAVMELDQNSSGVICLEEPENGIHPEKIKSVLELLKDMCTDTESAVDLDNPLRQVIINTHSPIVVQQVPDDSLLMAELRETVINERVFKRASFSPLSDTWRTKTENVRSVKLGDLIAYLNAVEVETEEESVPNTKAKSKTSSQKKPKVKRVIDRKDIRQLAFDFK